VSTKIEAGHTGFRAELRTRVARILVAVLVGTLFVPVVGITAPQILPTAAAAPGSFTIQGSNNAIAIDLPSDKAIANNTAYTVEAFIKIDIATNPLANANAQDAGGMYFTGTGVEDNWRQRGSSIHPQNSNKVYGSYYIMNNNVTPMPRCDDSGRLEDCPLIPIPRGQWTHLALQKSVVSGTTILRWFIDGKIVSSYNVTGGTSTATMKH
jgi:hypothetical protein